jgi:hypothetical protein
LASGFCDAAGANHKRCGAQHAQIPNANSQRPKNGIVKREKSSDCHSAKRRISTQINVRFLVALGMTEEGSIGAFRFFGVWSLGFGVFWTLGAQIPNANSQTPKNVIVKREKSSDCHSERSEESPRKLM